VTPESRAFVGATLLDGTGAPPLQNSAILVDGDRFSWVGLANEFEGTP
jgi:hypothetical protein